MASDMSLLGIHRLVCLLEMVMLLIILSYCSSGVTRFGCEGAGVEATSFCQSLVTAVGYPCEERQVTTDDGYILMVQRIPHGIKGSATTPKKPVFLLHGLLQGGESWVLNSPDQSLGFILADAGYDVWIGNLRGTRWSSKHLSLSNQDRSYWSWTWDEHAAYDLHAMLKLVFETTKMPSHFVGYSQGTIVFLAALSQSSVTQFVDTAALLSPIAYLNNVGSSLISTSAKTFLDQIVINAGVAQIGTMSGLGTQLLLNFCALEALDCSNLMTDLTGPNCCLNSSRISYYTNYQPQSTSTKNFAHLAQMVRSGKFCKYDYGSTAENMLKYAQSSPPTYFLSRIPTNFPLLLVYGGKDALADVNDVRHLLSDLPGRHQQIYLPNYAHLDFVLSTSASKDIYHPMVSFFDAHE